MQLSIMTDVLYGLAELSKVLRSVVLAGGAAFAAIAATDWAVRTRRINPFSGVSRFMRARVDPRLAGIERQVVRAGGHASNTPWWGLVVYVVVAALFLAVVDLAGSLAREVSHASSAGGTGFLYLLIHWTFRILTFAIIVRVLSSYFPRLARSFIGRWSFPLTEWMLRPLRSLIPNVGMFDISPIVAYFALQFVEWLLTQVLFR